MPLTLIAPERCPVSIRVPSLSQPLSLSGNTYASVDSQLPTRETLSYR